MAPWPCDKCDRYFQTSSNLIMHKLTHRTPNCHCYCCDRSFTTYGGMLIHLESGACTSGIRLIHLNKSAAMCYQWSKYLDTNMRKGLLDLEDDYLSSADDKPFKCPSCGTWFSKLSALFQHVESPSCSQTLNGGAIGKLRRWLYNRHA